MTAKAGRLLLCSHGPGDPDLLPVKTVRALGEATLALYPDSTPAGIVALIAPSARHESFPLTGAFVPGERTWADARAEMAQGGVVVRLYPDSPLLDPNALREARVLARDGVTYEIVSEPVIGMQAAAYAGVPLDVARGPVTLLAGQAAYASGTPDITTAIVTVGRLERPAEAAAALMGTGYRPDTPCLAVQRPARPSQEVREATLGSLGALPNSATGGLLIAGEAVRQRATFAWFERLPLSGKRVLVTRAHGQSGTMSARLRELGAEPVELPTIQIAPPSDPQPIDVAIARLDDFDWVVFTSANAVDAFFTRLDASNLDVRALGQVKVAAIGSPTAAGLRKHGVKADFVPERFVAEEVLAGLLERGAGHTRVLLPRAEQAREVLPEGLRQAGATVDVVAAYRTVVPEPSPAVLQLIRNRDIDVLTLTSSSTARNLASMLDGRLDSLRGALVACIGPITAETARQVGFQVDVVAEEYSIPGLIAAVVAACRRSTS